jgi:hypothetical protein
MDHWPFVVAGARGAIDLVRLQRGGWADADVHRPERLGRCGFACTFASGRAMSRFPDEDENLRRNRRPGTFSDCAEIAINFPQT